MESPRWILSSRVTRQSCILLRPLSWQQCGGEISGQDGNKAATRRQLWTLVQGRVTAFTRTKFLSRKPVPTPLQALGRVTSNRKFHRDKHSSSVQRCFQAAGNLSSRCVYEMCGAWECLPLSWLLSVTPWDSPWPGKPSDLDRCLSVCEEGPGIVFPFSSLSQADAFVKHNNDKLLGKRNEKVKKTKMWTLFLILRNKRKRTPSISALYLWESADCPSPQPVLMSRGRGETQESRGLRGHPRRLPCFRPSRETAWWQC